MLEDNMSPSEYHQYLANLMNDPVETEKYRQHVLSSPNADPKRKSELQNMTFIEWLDKKVND